MPKAVVRVDAEARFVSGPPRSPPTIDAAAKASTTGQSTFECVPTRAGPRLRASFTPLPCLSPRPRLAGPTSLRQKLQKRRGSGSFLKFWLVSENSVAAPLPASGAIMGA